MIPPLVLYLIPIIILAVGGLAIMMADAFQDREGGMAMPTAVVHVGAAAAALALWQYAGRPGAPEEASKVLGGYMAFDRQVLFLDATIGLGGAIVSLFAGGYLAEHNLERGEFYTLLTFASAGCMMLVGATDFIMVFVGLETLSLGVYALTGFRRTSARSTEGALKYFLLGSFAAALLLYGSALLYGITGHTDFEGIRASLASVPVIPRGSSAAVMQYLGEQQTVRQQLSIISMVLIVVSLGFKISAVPFHMWTPDAYEGAPTPATAYMSVAVKAAAFGALLRILLTVFGDQASFASFDGGWPVMLAWLAVLTMTVGNVIAVTQKSVKRMLAYSSISHAGYILIGVAASPRTDALAGTGLTVGQGATAAVLFYLLGYTVTNVGAFGALILAGRHKKEAVDYDDLVGLGKRHPAAALALTFFMFSLTGVPPTVGFFAKFYVIRSALDAGFTWLAVLAVINSAIAGYYYLRVMVAMYMEKPRDGVPLAEPMNSGLVTGGLLISAFFVLYFGLAPQKFLEYATEAVRRVVAS